MAGIRESASELSAIRHPDAAPHGISVSTNSAAHSLNERQLLTEEAADWMESEDEFDLADAEDAVSFSNDTAASTEAKGISSSFAGAPGDVGREDLTEECMAHQGELGTVGDGLIFREDGSCGEFEDETVLGLAS